ncbi:MAG: metallophosphoesterase [Thermomicrobiales bacterium]
MRRHDGRSFVRAGLFILALLLLPLGPILATKATLVPVTRVSASAEPASRSGIEAAAKRHKKKKCRKKSQAQSDTHVDGEHKKKRKKCPNPPGPTSEVMLAVGDIALCTGESLTNLQASAGYINGTPGTVAVLGDLVYPNGEPDKFKDCYGKYYGPFVNRTYPTPGNHEYYYNCSKTGPWPSPCTAAPYFDWFKAQAGVPAVVQGMQIGEGWYSYELGNWNIYVLNSSGSEPNGAACGWVKCNSGSAQYKWLQAELAKDQKAGSCALAYWHHPLFNSGNKGASTDVKDFWQLLYQANAELVLNGHQHMYERFAPQTPNGVSDPQRGIREFIVGTGGAELNQSTPAGIANSQARIAKTVGVLQLTLRQNGYDFAFVDSKTGAVLDSGSGSCH